MPSTFCSACGVVHDLGDTVTCGRNRVEVPQTRAAKRMPKAALKEEMVEAGAAAKPMSLTERKQAVARRIEELEMEREVQELEEKFERLVAEKEEREQRGQPAFHDSDVMKEGAATGTKQTEGEALPDQANPSVHQAYSGYGRERLRSRDTRRRRRSSSSSTSSSRRRQSKWSLKKFTMGGKEPRKLNGYEVICATTRWALGLKGLRMADYRAMFEHINFISGRAVDNDFADVAHAEYDIAIRKQAEEMGFAAFATANQATSIVHYGSQNLRTRKATAGSTLGRRRSPHSRARRACYAWNGEQGCARSEDDCRYSHICSKCGGKSHRRPKCKE